MLFEPEQAWLHEVISEHEIKQTDISSAVYTAQWLRQLRIFPMLGR
jgi:predicted metal-dependent HD superfamily phosphohydrolase